MKNYQDSDYALNKYSKGIVYRFADGVVEVTLEDYLAENPGKTPDDFMELKRLSDEMYNGQDRDENAQTKKNISFDELETGSFRYAPSPEEMFIGEIDAQEEAEDRKRRLRIANNALDTLTDVQRRRYLLHFVDELSTWEIARIEGTNQKSVHESLQAAQKKIKKFLENA